MRTKQSLKEYGVFCLSSNSLLFFVAATIEVHGWTVCTVSVAFLCIRHVCSRSVFSRIIVFFFVNLWQSFSMAQQFSLKRTGTGSVKDVARDFEQDKVLKACPGSLTLFVALNPKQFEDLQCGKPVLPDPYSGRFGLRSDQAVAVKRGYEFTNWHPASVSHPPPPVHPKQFMIMKVLLTAQGYMTLMEENVLVKGDGSNPCREGYFRWWGPLVQSRSALVNGKEELLFTICESYDMYE